MKHALNAERKDDCDVQRNNGEKKQAVRFWWVKSLVSLQKAQLRLSLCWRLSWVQIDFSSLNLEQWLLILLLAYVLSFALLALVKGRKYLKSYPSGKEHDDYFRHSFNVKLTFAGLSATSLALFIGLGLSGLERLSSIILFFSISFVAFVVSSNFARFPRGSYTFIADVLENMGILAIGCGFLVFFEKELPSYELILTYMLFIMVFIFLSSIHFYKFYRYLSSFESASKSHVQKWVKEGTLGSASNSVNLPIKKLKSIGSTLFPTAT